jgi:hypothetical protein
MARPVVTDFSYRSKPRFEVHLDPPKGINIKLPELPEPRYPNFLSQVGIERIVDSVDIELSGDSMNIFFSGAIVSELIEEQREVIIAHLGHIVNFYKGYNTSKVSEFTIKKQFHDELIILSQLEEEPGDFG